MLLCFDPLAIAHWATLSGDDNPIHFDVRQARARGCRDVVAHGMLVLLKIKQALFAPSSATHPEWIDVKAILREPVLLNRPYRLLLNQGQQHNRFQLCADSAGAAQVTGYQCLIPPPALSDELAPAETLFTVENDFYQTKKAAFLAVYADVTQAVLLVESIVFAHFLKSQILPYWVNRLMGLPHITTLDTLLSTMRVLQTTHRLSIAPSMMAWKISDLPQVKGIQYSCPQPDMYPVGKGNTAFVFLTEIMIDKQFLLRIEMGLVVSDHFSTLHEQ